MPIPRVPILRASSLDWDNAVNTKNRTTRYILPLPDWGAAGELLVHPQTGEWLKKTEQRGAVFHNGEDSVFQAARGDGTQGIAFNAISREQAAYLHRDILRSVREELSRANLLKRIWRRRLDGIGRVIA